MARKAGPLGGAEDAPEGRADLPGTGGPAEERVEPAPDGAETGLTEAPPAGEPPAPAAPASPEGGDDRIDALSEEGLGVLHLGTPIGATAPAEGAAAAPEEWSTAPRSGHASAPLPSGEGWAAGEPGGADSAAPGDPWRHGAAGVGAGLAGAATSEGPLPPRSDPPAPVAAPHPPSRRRGGIGALLLGGMIAAALGFGAAWLAQDRLGLFPARLPADWDERLAALEARPLPDTEEVQALADRLAEAEARLGALEEAPASPAEPTPSTDLGPLREEVAQGLEQAQARAAELEERLAALESRPEPAPAAEAPEGSPSAEAGPSAPADPTFDPEALRDEVLASIEPRLSEAETALSEIQADLSEAESALAALDERLGTAEEASAAAAEEARAAASATAEVEARAAAAESQARARGALAGLDDAFDAGEPFEASLAELDAAGVPAPEPLARLAAEGAPTLAALRESFPEAARAGLAAARDEGLLDRGNGVWDFLSGQLSVRSTQPREGTDPDAVLSRAESALAAGRLDVALAEVGSLPDPVQSAMADWIARARARAEAEAALGGLLDAAPAAPAAPAD